MGERAGEEWVSELRDRGYRLTTQRRLVLDAVRRLQHATPEEAYEHLRRAGRSVNLATVYRSLDLLTELGLVNHGHLGPGPQTYHVVDHADHVHLLCRSCARVTQAPLELAGGFVSALREQHGFAADLGHLTVYGTCADCAAAAPAN